jgi:hypothetical protein
MQPKPRDILDPPAGPAEIGSRRKVSDQFLLVLAEERKAKLTFNSSSHSSEPFMFHSANTPNQWIATGTLVLGVPMSISASNFALNPLGDPQFGIQRGNPSLSGMQLAAIASTRARAASRHCSAPN